MTTAVPSGLAFGAVGDTRGAMRKVQRRQLLWQGVVGAGALALGPRALQALAGPAPLVDLSGARPIATAVPAPPIISRAQWGANESLRSGSPEFAPLRRAIVHHTVTATNESNPIGRMRAIYEFHTAGRGWSDIAYNFVVDGAGRVYEGRRGGSGAPDGEDGSGRGVIGAHAKGHNAGSVGIAMLGTYTDGRILPTEAALDAVAAVVAWKFGPRGIDPRAAGALVGHRDVVATGCPGDGLYHRLPELRHRAQARIVPPVLIAPDDGGLVEDLLDLVVDAPDLPLL